MPALPAGAVVNINAPAIPPERLRPAVLCSVSNAFYLDRYERRVSPKGQIYYWLNAGLAMEEAEPDSDYDYLHRGHVTVTVLTGFRQINEQAAGFLDLQ